MFEGFHVNWLETAKILSSIATPIAVAVVGYFINKRLKSIDDAQWQSRKIIEKRLDLYEKIAPNLNAVFCFLMWVGYWKDISPRKMIDLKRELDKTVNIYRHLLSEEFYESYNTFIMSGFRTFTGHGKDALIRSEIESFWGDRRTHRTFEWEDQFSDLFEVKMSKAEKTSPLHTNMLWKNYGTYLASTIAILNNMP